MFSIAHFYVNNSSVIISMSFVPDAEENRTFDQVMQLFHAKLDDLLGDPLLCDLHHQITLDEVKSLTSLERGQAIAVDVRRADGEVYSVIVEQGASVRDLKRAIRRHVELLQSREGGTRHISWRYVWRTYWLVSRGVKLKDDHRLLRDYEIGNRDEVSFIPRLKEKC